MFEIRVVTPAVTGADGRLQAAGMLRAGAVSLPFLLDLSCWRIGDYQQQWRGAIDRLVRGAPAAALMTGYNNDPTRPQRMWALWRDGDYVYIQSHVVVPDEVDAPFNPLCPEPHLGARLSAEYGLPIAEWRVEMVQLIMDSFGFRLPLYPR